MNQIKSAVFGFAIAPLVLIGAVVMLAWNEGRSVERIRALAIGEGAVVAGSADAPDPRQDGALVHVTGQLSSPDRVTDPIFGLDLPAVALRREVEMYQWQERTEETGNKKRTTYAMGWSDEVVDSSRFERPEGHENPGAMPVEAREVLAERIELGALTLGASMRNELDFYQPMEITSDALAAMSAPAREGYALVGGKLASGGAAPRLGDVRVSFVQVPHGAASAVARQADGRLEAYRTGHGDITLLASGTSTAAEMFDAARTENAILTWILRGLGTVLLMGGFAAPIRPLTMLGAWVPVLGGVLEAAGMGAALLAGTATSLTVIAVSWMAVRPVLSIGLFGLIGGAVLVFLALRRGAGAAPAPAARPVRTGPPKAFGQRAAG